MGRRGELTGLDVSTDGGQAWKPARFVGGWDRYSWRKWEYDWDAAPERPAASPGAANIRA